MKYELPKNLHILSSLLLVVGLTSISDSNDVLAQNYNTVEPLCYWQTADGRKIDLSRILCGIKPTEAKSQTQKNSPLQIDEKTLGGLAYTYAHQYCDWREAGGRSRDESKSNALRKLTDTIIMLYGTDRANQVVDKLDINFFQTTDRLIQQICPKDK